MHMGKSKRTGLSARSDWPVRLSTGVGGAAAGTIALLLRPDMGGFWQGLIAYMAVLLVGMVAGNLVGRLLFRPPSGGPPN